jgi:hypothetical protein
MHNMNISPKRQSQFELFPGVSPYIPEAGKPASLTKDLTLSLENIIVLCIIFIVTLVLFFSFGVERGKRVVLVPKADSDKAEMNATENEAGGLKSAADVEVVQQGKTVVFPVDVPQEISEENESAVQPPVEKTEEQEKLFTIQVASYKKEKDAQREADRLKGIGHNDTFVIPKGDYIIVCVGKFMQMSDAKKFSGQLKKQYNDCLVRRL